MILTTTLAHGDAKADVLEAFESARPLADAFLLLDTGITDDTVRAARDLVGADLIVYHLSWPGSFADARNAALEHAARLEASWAVTLDADERLEGDVSAFRRELQTAIAGAVMVRSACGGYAKDRAIKIPCPVRWKGRVHEAIPTHTVVREVSKHALFRERPKPPGDLQAKLRRDREALLLEIRDNPGEARWHYYLGQTLEDLGEFEAARKAFIDCAEFFGWDEESAWACYRAAWLYCRAGDCQQAIRWCAAGLERHAGVSELAWLAGFASYQIGRYDQAVYWAHAALAIHAQNAPRIAFRHPEAHRLPYDVLRFAYRKLGQTRAADEAEALWTTM